MKVKSYLNTHHIDRFYLNNLLIMEVQRNIVLETKKVIACSKNLQAAIDMNNKRIVQKYVDQMQALLDKLLKACVDAEMNDVGEEETWMVEARTADQEGQSMLIRGEDYLSEVFNTESLSAVQRVNKLKLIELISNIKSFQDSIKTPAVDTVKDVEIVKQNDVLNRNMSHKREQWSIYQHEKVSLISEECSKSNEEEVNELNELFKVVTIRFNSWCEEANKHFIVQPSIVTMTEKSRGPELKVDRLSLPVYKGEVRNYARFVRDFENTVGHQFTNPKIKLMYLQNQCLVGPAKECIRNMTNYEEAMSRLKERFGRIGLVLDTVLKELKDMRLPDEESRAVVFLARVLERAWDDLSAIDAVDEFCNIVTLGIVESKLPHRIQILWAQIKKEGSSKELMMDLRGFIEDQRKIAENVLAMRGKTLEFERQGAKPKPKPDVKLVQSVNMSTPVKKCYRCNSTIP